MATTTSFPHVLKIDEEDYDCEIIKEREKSKLEEKIERDKAELKKLLEDGEDHEAIQKFMDYLKENKVSLQTPIEEAGRKDSTLMKKLIEEVSDGFDIVEHILSGYVTLTNDPKIVKIDFSKINDKVNNKETSVVSDLVNLSLLHSESFLSSICNPIKSIFMDICSKSETFFDDKRNIHDVKSKACRGNKKLSKICKIIKSFKFYQIY